QLTGHRLQVPPVGAQRVRRQLPGLQVLQVDLDGLRNVHGTAPPRRSTPVPMKPDGAGGQLLRMNRSSTRTPNCSESTGTRSSTPWNRALKSRSAGSLSGANP